MGLYFTQMTPGNGFCITDRNDQQQLNNVLVEKDELEALPASLLRTMLITEIQKFIHALDFKSSIINLIAERDHIKALIEILSRKEEAEFDQMMGRYFPNAS